MSGARRQSHVPSGLPVIDPVTAPVRPFWSIMIPSFNSAELLAQTLESVLAEDPGPEVMHIEVVDDCSSRDDPAATVQRVGGNRVAFYRQPRNVGASANFTTCARRSIGRWVHILHSDDLIEPDFYPRYRARIEACPDVGLVAGRTVAVDAEGRHLAMTPPVATEAGYMLDPALVIASTNPLRCVSVVVARFVYEKWGGFHPGLVHANDWEMWARVASRERVGWVDGALGLHRMHQASDTSRLHQSTAYLDDCLKAANAIADHFPPERRDQARRAAKRNVCDYALSVGQELLDLGELRLAAANAWRAVTIDRSAEVRAQAWPIVRQAVSARLRRQSVRADRPAAP